MQPHIVLYLLLLLFCFGMTCRMAGGKTISSASGPPRNGSEGCLLRQLSYQPLPTRYDECFPWKHSECKPSRDSNPNINFVCSGKPTSHVGPRFSRPRSRQSEAKGVDYKDGLCQVCGTDHKAQDKAREKWMDKEMPGSRGCQSLTRRAGTVLQSTRSSIR